ncbi:MAG: ankyrin repeat domain-containing protein, partial [Verrucomicrobiales bacterium]
MWISFFLGGSVVAEEPELVERLRSALFAEEGAGDLAEAENEYIEILRQYDEDRAFVAVALLRLGTILSDRGEVEAAEKLFARVLREFGDKEEAVRVARAKLDGAPAAAGKGEVAKGEAGAGRLRQLIAESPDLLRAKVAGVTPLERAAGRGETAIVRYLIAEGADANGEGTPYKSFASLGGKVVRTPLGRAVAGGHPEVVDLLLLSGAELVDGLLHTAVATGNLKVTRRLLAAGADPNQRFESGAILSNPEAINAGRRHPTVSYSRVPSRSGDGDPALNLSPLEMAAKKEFGILARALLQGGAKPMPRDDGESYSLKFAIEAGDAELVAALLEHGANASSVWEAGNRREVGSTALHIAADSGFGQIVKLLLAGGAEIGALTEHGRTPLHLATGAAVRVLIESGADIEAVDEGGRTPLGCLFGGEAGVEKARVLLAAGADVNARSGNGQTPLLSAIEFASLEALKLLIGTGADVTQASEFMSPIGMAVVVARPDLIAPLAGAGADPDLRNAAGQTPLHLAIENLRAPSVAALLDAGADPNAEGAEGRPPLAMLLIRGQRPRVAQERVAGLVDEIIRLLVDAGADPDATDQNGQTVLHKVALLGSEETVDYLLSEGASAIAGDQPAFEVRNDTGSIRSKLFLAAQLQAADRATVIRVIAPGYAVPVAVINSYPGEGGELPPCPHSLFEVFAFFTNYLSSDGELRIWHAGEAVPQHVDLGGLLAAADPAGDVALRWGDVVEFANSEEDGQTPISDAARQMLEEHLARSIEFIWNDDSGDEVRRENVRFFPGWQRATKGRGWVPGAGNSYGIDEGATDVALLATL